MITNLLYDFSVDRDNRSITIKREFAADPGKVWDSFTKSMILDQWWAPKPWKARTKEMDFREGGRWLYAMIGPDGEEHWAVAHFRNIRQYRSFAVHDAFSDEEGRINENMPRADWEVNFLDQDHTTLVTFHIVYEDVRQLDTTLQMGFREGISSALGNLDELLERENTRG